MGMNDATYGAIIPYLQDFYNLQYAVISLIFLSPFVGYNLSALLNNAVHMKFGQRGVAFIGAFCHLVSYIVIALHPPYPVLVIAFIFAGFGNGLLDAGWNAWIGVMANANEMLGLLHAFYGVGATIAPFVATTMITKANLPWYYWYYCMVSLVRISLLVVFANSIFRLASQLSSLERPSTPSGKQMAQRSATRTLVHPVLVARA
jgi:fucose permease